MNTQLFVKLKLCRRTLAKCIHSTTSPNRTSSHRTNVPKVTSEAVVTNAKELTTNNLKLETLHLQRNLWAVSSSVAVVTTA
jgi:hypothetical protein